MRKVRMRRDVQEIKKRFELVKSMRLGDGALEDEILLSLGFNAMEVALAVKCSEKQVRNWHRNGLLTPVASLGRVPVFASDEVVGLFSE
jgi:hypothetical protein